MCQVVPMPAAAIAFAAEARTLHRSWSAGGKHLAELRGEPVGIAGLPVLATEESPVVAGEDDDVGVEALRDRFRAAMGQLAVRLRARRHGDARRRDSQR